ncbi:tetraspanin 37 isoform X1 [Labrus mixtus]|uniref:tetraspanin 37 isoform X1 n=1 Tax=Labrus mixtus TaxID=508554 RepID=UPI0029BFE893|nr:tetraspanin 37 isoform X1 [Labrus mixtus]
MRDQRRKAWMTILQLISNLLWVVGLVVGLSGFYLLLDYRQSSIYFSHIYIILPAVLALCSAVLLVVSGFLGSLKRIEDSPILQGLFVYLLVVVFCLESTASVLAYFHSTKLDSELASLAGVFQEYTGSSQDPKSLAVDVTQEELQCCGVHDYRDWLDTSWFNVTGGELVPYSCCNSSFPSCNGTVGQPWKLNTQGCQVKLEISFQFLLDLIIWCSPAVFLVELVMFVILGQLMRDQPLRKYQELNK